jgi:hypothetical protein
MAVMKKSIAPTTHSKPAKVAPSQPPAKPTSLVMRGGKLVPVRTIPSQVAWAELLARGTRIFTVRFRRKHKGQNGEPKGSIRVMTCRLRVRKYTNSVTGLGRVIPPAVRRAEDVRCNVLTVFDIQLFNQYRHQGYGVIAAGRASYRRVNMAQVVSISGYLP